LIINPIIGDVNEDWRSCSLSASIMLPRENMVYTALQI
jgi:hypothetical protein